MFTQFYREPVMVQRYLPEVLEGRPHIVDAMKNGEVRLVFNTTDSVQAITDSFSLRRTALVNRIPYYTTASGARAAGEGITALKAGQLEEIGRASCRERVCQYV